VIVAAAAEKHSGDNGGQNHRRPGPSGTRWSSSLADLVVSLAGGGRWYGPAFPRLKGAARPFGTGLQRPLTRGTLRPWPCGTAGSAVALPASRARRPPCPGSAQQEVADQLVGFAVTEPFPGPVVEFSRDPVQVRRGVHRQVAAFGEVLAQQAVGRSYVCQAASVRPLNAAAVRVADWMRR
jgi:hypothetical protein